MSRFVVIVTGGVPPIEKLKAALGRPWRFVYDKKNEHGEWIFICEAPNASAVWEKALEGILCSALGATDFEWWHEKEYTAATAAEKVALERLKLALAVRRDHLRPVIR